MTDRPKVLIADTIKGKGVSFMEGLACGDQTYHFHAGAPSLKDYLAAVARADRADRRAALRAGDGRARRSRVRRSRCALRRSSRNASCSPTATNCCRWRARARTSSSWTPTCCRTAASRRSRQELPERFIECGIAEQHMVSAAGGMALNGILPVVHSFACFLSTRANEHIYNNATERTKDHLHGDARRRRSRRSRTLASVGARHLRDRFGARPDRDRAVQRARSAARHPLGGRSRTAASTYLRFVNVPLDLPYALPAVYTLEVGRGVTLRDGRRRRDRRLRPAAA